MSERRFIRRKWMAASATGWGVAAIAQPGKASFLPETGRDATPTTILFFDDQRLNLRDRVTRHVGRPERMPESFYQDPKAHVGWGYPGVFRDEASGKWRMTYLAWAYHKKPKA